MPTTTFGALRRRVQVLTGNRIDAVRASILLNQKFTEIAESYSWSWLKGHNILTTTAARSDGAVTLTTPTTVTGVGTSFGAGDIGSYLRVALDVSYYRITNVVGQVLTLENQYAGGSFTASAYVVFRHIYPLVAEARRLLQIAHWARLRETTQQIISESDALLTLSDIPTHFAYAGQHASGAMQIQLYPVPSAAIGLPYDYLKTIAEPTDDATMVPLRPDVLTYSTAADALYTVIAEAPNPAAVQGLLALAQRYEEKGMAALQEARYSDQAIAGVPRSVRDDSAQGMYNDAWLASHDLGVF